MQSIGKIVSGKEPSYSGRGIITTPIPMPNSTMVGFELELEGGIFADVDGWRRVADGSLRDGIEYIFNGPAGGKTAHDRITRMGKYLSEHPCRPTFRCSTHIHMDVRDFTQAELAKLIAAYCVFEDVMFDHVALERRYSNFCTPLFMNDGLMKTLADSFWLDKYTDVAKVSNLGRWSKYSALNLQPITNFGSVEFRGSHALTTKDDMLNLMLRMLHLKQAVYVSEDMPLKDFIRNINKMTPQQMFPTGLTEGYVRKDQALADKCYSNALLLLRKGKSKAGKTLNTGIMDELAVLGSSGAPSIRSNGPYEMGWTSTIRNTERPAVYDSILPGGWNIPILHSYGIDTENMELTIHNICRVAQSLTRLVVNSPTRIHLSHLVEQSTRVWLQGNVSFNEMSRFYGLQVSFFTA